MIRLLPRLLALAVVLAPTAVLTTPPSVAGPAQTSTAVGATVTRTLSGHVERLAAVHRDGTDSIRWELDTGDRAWTLRPRDTRLVPGARMEVSGVVSGDVLEVRSARVLRAPQAESGLRARASSTRILVMRVYWNASPPANPTATKAKEALVTRSAAWFRNVSGGRYSVAGSVTPWLKISAPGGCPGNTNRVMDQALARAKAKGFAPANFGRHMVYMPCNGGGITGLGSMPGKRIWLFGTIGLDTNVHEQGHNLGLPHAKLRTCRSSGTRTTWSGSCSVQEYGDWSDAMGNGPPAHYNIVYKRLLGWAGSTTTVSGDTTRTLVPTEVTTAGLKGLGVKTSNRTYWFELRNGANEDAGIHPDCRGLQVRFKTASGTQALDLFPGNASWFGSTTYYDDDSCTSLPIGSSWVTPEGVRVIAKSGSLSAVQVQVDYGFGAAKAPLAPTGLTADSSVPDRVTLDWDKPSDQGSLITRYDVKRPDDVVVAVRSLGGDVLSRAVDDLDPGSYATGALQVRAVNRVGASPWASAPGFTVSTRRPAVTITSPTGGSVSGRIDVGWSATPNPVSGQEIVEAALEVDGEEDWGQDVSGTNGTFPWWTTDLPNGSHILRVKVTDAAGKVGWSAPVTVTVSNPVVAITSPGNGATVQGKINVSFTVANAGSWSFTSGEVRFNGRSTPATLSGGVWSALVDTRTSPNDTYSLIASVEDPVRGTVDKTIEVTSTNTMPTITVSSPSGTITNPLQRVTFTTDTSWPWDGFRAQVGGEVVGYAEAGDPLDVDLSRFAPGTYTLRVYGEYGCCHAIASAGRSLTFQWPTRSLAWGSGAPLNNATVSGEEPVAYTLSPPSAWSWQSVCVQVKSGADWWSYDCSQPGTPLTFSTWWVDNGTYQVRLEVTDSANDRRHTEERTWTVANP